MFQEFLIRRVVVEAQPIDEVLAADLSSPHGAQVQIVPRPSLVGTVIGDLGKAAEVRADAAGKKDAALVER